MNEMETFIKKSLLDIRNGVRSANTEIAELEGGVLGKDKAALFQFQPENTIDFDIAVTAQRSDEKGGGLKISVVSIGIGGFLKKNTSNEQISRIKFSLKPGLRTG